MVKEAVPPCAWTTEGGANLAHTWAVPVPGPLHACVPSFLGATSLLPTVLFSRFQKEVSIFEKPNFVVSGHFFPSSHPGSWSTLPPSPRGLQTYIPKVKTVSLSLHSLSLGSQEAHTTYWIGDEAHSWMQWQLPREEGRICFVY